MTNNQILLKECIKQEFKENNSFATENDFFEFFAASQLLKNYNLPQNYFWGILLQRKLHEKNYLLNPKIYI